MAEKKTAKKPESSDKTFKASDIKFQAKTSSSRSKYKHDKFSRKEILLGLVLVLFLAIPVVFFAFSGEEENIDDQSNLEEQLALPLDEPIELSQENKIYEEYFERKIKAQEAISKLEVIYNENKSEAALDNIIVICANETDEECFASYIANINDDTRYISYNLNISLAFAERRNDIAKAQYYYQLAKNYSEENNIDFDFSIHQEILGINNAN